jgi:hypothetical protein
MAWSGSAVFAAYIQRAILNDPAVAGSWGGGDAATGARFFCALFDATATPDAYAADAATFYGQGAWAGGEQTGGAWPAGGIAANLTAGTIMSSAGAAALHHPSLSLGNVTVHGVCGDLVYDQDTGRGLGFHDFGGPVDVDNGTLIMTWDDPPGVICVNYTPPTGPARKTRPAAPKPAPPRRRRKGRAR